MAGRPERHLHAEELIELETLWEAYQAAVRNGRARGDHRLPDDLVADLKADHDAMARGLRRRAAGP